MRPPYRAGRTAQSRASARSASRTRLATTSAAGARRASSAPCPANSGRKSADRRLAPQRRGERQLRRVGQRLQDLLAAAIAEHACGPPRVCAGDRGALGVGARPAPRDRAAGRRSPGRPGTPFHLRRARPQHERRSQPAPVRDATRGHHRHGHGVDHLGHERERAHGTVVAVHQDSCRGGRRPRRPGPPRRPPALLEIACLGDRGGAREHGDAALRQAASASSPGSPKWKLTTGGWISSSASSRCSSKPPAAWTARGLAQAELRVQRRERRPGSADRGSIQVRRSWQKKLSWNGRSVPARTAATWARSSSTSSIAEPRAPSPPAALTAAASSGVAALAMGAWRTGCSTPSSSVTRVRTGSEATPFAPPATPDMVES